MHVLSLITWLPFAGAILILFAPKDNKLAVRVLAAIFSGAAFIASLWLWVNFNISVSDLQFIEKFSWIPTFGIHYFMAVDGLSLPLIVLTTLLTLLSVIGSFHIELRVKEYFFFFLLLETAMLGVFV